MTDIIIRPEPEAIEAFIDRSARKGQAFTSAITALAPTFEVERIASDGAYLILDTPSKTGNGRIILCADEPSDRAYRIAPVRTIIAQDWEITAHLETPADLLKTIALAIQS